MYQQQTCSIGATEVTSSTPSASGIHYTRRRGMSAATSPAPTEGPMPGRPPRRKIGARNGPSFRIEESTEDRGPD
eukprot:4668738-Pyramimonas_sp.AAC.1